MSNILDTVQISGSSYDLKDKNAAGVSGVTQAEYDALVSGGTVDPNMFYVITDATPQDLSNYWTSAQTNAAISAATSGKVNTSTYNTYTAATNTALAGKQATLVSGTNIKTINNESILGSGNINIQGGGVNVVQTTGTSTTDVMSQDAVTTALNNKANKTAAFGGYKFRSISGNDYLQYINVNNTNIGTEIYYPKINGKGIFTNNSTFAQNNYNFQLVETSAITTSISSGSTDSEIPTAKAVYDAVGSGGGGTVDQTIISGSTNAVSGGAVYEKLDEIEQVVARALNDLEDRITAIENQLNNS